MNGDTNDQTSDGESPLERALWQISILDLEAFSINDRLKAVAAIFLSALNDFLEDGGAAVIAQEARGIYEHSAAESSSLAADIRGITRQRIGQMIDSFFLSALDPQRALERAQTQKQAVKELNSADIVLIAQALQSLLPPTVKTLLLERGLIDQTPTGEWAKNLIKAIASKPAAELARDYVAAARQFPREEAADRLYNITHNMTDEKLSALFNHIGKHYPVQDFMALAVGGLAVLNHVLEDVVRHGIPSRMPAADRAVLAAWGKQAADFLTVFEDAARAAGLGDDIYDFAAAVLPQGNQGQAQPSTPPPPPVNPRPNTPPGPQP